LNWIAVAVIWNDDRYHRLLFLDSKLVKQLTPMIVAPKYLKQSFSVGFDLKNKPIEGLYPSINDAADFV
jgi:hypothetical protein